MPTPFMLDFYNGGGCDAAFLGCAEVRSRHVKMEQLKD
jgi:acyl CoA:acetate/3-ketoacid CoA transferase